MKLYLITGRTTSTSVKVPVSAQEAGHKKREVFLAKGGTFQMYLPAFSPETGKKKAARMFRGVATVDVCEEVHNPADHPKQWDEARGCFVYTEPTYNPREITEQRLRVRDLTWAEVHAAKKGYEDARRLFAPGKDCEKSLKSAGRGVPNRDEYEKAFRQMWRIAADKGFAPLKRSKKSKKSA